MLSNVLILKNTMLFKYPYLRECESNFIYILSKTPGINYISTSVNILNLVLNVVDLSRHGSFSISLSLVKRLNHIQHAFSNICALRSTPKSPHL